MVRAVYRPVHSPDAAPNAWRTSALGADASPPYHGIGFMLIKCTGSRYLGNCIGCAVFDRRRREWPVAVSARYPTDAVASQRFGGRYAVRRGPDRIAIAPLTTDVAVRFRARRPSALYAQTPRRRRRTLIPMPAPDTDLDEYGVRGRGRPLLIHDRRRCRPTCKTGGPTDRPTD